MMNLQSNKVLVQWIRQLTLASVLIVPSFTLYAESGHDDSQTNDTHEGDAHSDEDEHDEGHIELTAEQIKHAGIGLAQVKPANIREVLPVYGLVVPNAERVQSVGARFDGVIRKVNKQTGDTVKKGEVLAEVESNDSLKNYSLKSAISGIIIERNANIGEQTAERTLFVVADFSTVWVDLSLFPSDTGKVHVGQVARITSSDGTLVADGKIIYVAPFGQSQNQTIKGRVLLDNKNGDWIPGHFITADITLADTPVLLAVNNEAIQIVENRTVIFVKGEEGFEPRPVTLGRSDGDITEVMAGLVPEETYVTKNSFILKSELGKEDAEHGH
jgi:cobalt-zinc-cadmium efflux system membrane fusion protein